MRLGQKLRELVSSNIVGNNDDSDEDDYINIPNAKAAPAPQVSQPLPPPVAPPPPPVETPMVVPGLEILTSAGNVGSELTPESVSQMISALPDTLPMRVKRAAIRNAIQQQGKDGADVESILGEATWKKMQMIQRLQKLDAEHKSTLDAINAEIAQLAAQRDQITNSFNSQQTSISTEMGQIDRVIQFLGTDLAGSAPVSGLGSRGEEVPPHLRDETAARLLGIHE
jgi:hypothetical protein